MLVLQFEAFRFSVFGNIRCLEEHFLLHCKKYDALRKNSKFISETMHDLGIGADTVKHILNPQTKQNCKSVTHFIDDALHERKSSINK